MKLFSLFLVAAISAPAQTLFIRNADVYPVSGAEMNNPRFWFEGAGRMLKIARALMRVTLASMPKECAQFGKKSQSKKVRICASNPSILPLVVLTGADRSSVTPGADGSGKLVDSVAMKPLMSRWNALTDAKPVAEK